MNIKRRRITKLTPYEWNALQIWLSRMPDDYFETKRQQNAFYRGYGKLFKLQEEV